MRRTAGITHLTLFTRPASCGGACLFCPRAPDVPHSYLPHSYVGRMGLTYDPDDQARHWIRAVERSGRTAAKLEVILLGGSFSAHPVDYQEAFLSGLYRAVLRRDASDRASLPELVHEHAERIDGHRIIGITVECRPDQVTPALCRRLFEAGVTKIEMGVQSLDDSVLAFNDRGHDSTEVARATRVIRQSGLKTGYHLILGLPGADAASDARSMRTIFADPAYRPDHLKIYFCEMFRREFMRPRLVELFDSGRWRPLDAFEREARLAEVLPMVPPFVRISRIGRKSTPEELTVPKVRLDRAVLERRHGCGCIRCREPGPREQFEPGQVVVRRLDLDEGEWYVEAGIEGRRTCLGVLRLRLTAREAIVRELHVYGLEAAPGARGIHQHRGIGRLLMAEAEEMARRNGIPALAVSSGPGVRNYYKKLGYRIDAAARMTKFLAGSVLDGASKEPMILFP